MNEHDQKKNVWEIILRVVIAVASALAATFGITACVGWFKTN